MAFLSNLVFWMIFILVLLPILFFAPVPTLIVLAVIVVGGIGLGILRIIWNK